MDFNSSFFDRIRIRPSCEEPREPAGHACDKIGCRGPGTHRAPKGRGREGQFWRFCLDHVREYNASYNYVAGMSDDAVVAYQKDAVIGHRPTFPMGLNAGAKRDEAEVPLRDWAYVDPLGILRGERFSNGRRRSPEPPRPRRHTGVIRRALDTLGLEDSADAASIKAQYKALVKRFHPDAHGGDRSFEERLRDIIRAHDTLKAAGLC